ncbi:hypothetical protein EVAR_20479_1 [Eumeta japonica]|uniref:Uncharacterized protein n=1 Tax=Eumeta variegata TaxID=151549 RepID=A0A4C1TZB3_EUMVA|nr:hypothetical protein EVAR_20479_1 [Eumeta japonica]
MLKLRNGRIFVAVKLVTESVPLVENRNAVEEGSGGVVSHHSHAVQSGKDPCVVLYTLMPTVTDTTAAISSNNASIYTTSHSNLLKRAITGLNVRTVRLDNAPHESETHSAWLPLGHLNRGGVRVAAAVRAAHATPRRRGPVTAFRPAPTGAGAAARTAVIPHEHTRAALQAGGRKPQSLSGFELASTMRLIASKGRTRFVNCVGELQKHRWPTAISQFKYHTFIDTVGGAVARCSLRTSLLFRTIIGLSSLASDVQRRAPRPLPHPPSPRAHPLSITLTEFQEE